jgi:FixJ family two-component response regulator
MAPTKQNQAAAAAAAAKGAGAVKPPRVLVVDDEAELLELITDTVAKGLGCKLIPASNLTEARRALESQRIDLLVTDLHLPDGDGMSLLPVMQLHQPTAQAIIITGQATLDGAIEAIRCGATDFVKKPFTGVELADRINRALARVAAAAKGEKRLTRLRDAVKRLNDARKLVSKKVDLLCNDLINAYGELSKQLDLVRVQESYKAVLEKAADLEQLLCHTMDWLLRQLGYSNIAVWLAGDDEEMQLGAYMKYTLAGEAKLTDALRRGLVKLTLKEGHLHLSGDALRAKLNKDELQYLAAHDVLAVNCTYLAESLGVIVMFREAKGAFTEEDAATLKAVSPLFAVSLANIVKGGEHGAGEDPDDPHFKNKGEGGLLDENQQDKPKPRDKKKDDADWWKRGEPPPF